MSLRSYFISFFFFLLILSPSMGYSFTQKQIQPSVVKSKNLYVPKNLEDAHIQLEKLLMPEDLKNYKNRTEEDIDKYHFGLGMNLRNDWGLWKGSRLSRYFNDMGIHHPDDMSGIILSTFWCKLNNKPFKLKQRIEFYKAFWAANIPPKEGSPIDRAEIYWVMSSGPKDIQKAYKHLDPSQFKGIVHLGFSTSDASKWRFEVGSGRGIEPASAKESKQLDEWDKRTKALSDSFEKGKNNAESGE